MKRIRHIGLIWLAGFALLLASCTTDTECRQTSGIRLNVIFNGDSLRPSTDSVRLSIDPFAMDTIPFSTFSGMEIHGLGRDSIIYTVDEVINKVKLPLRPDSLHTDFVLTYNGHIDTLQIYHKNDMQFISLACGCFVFHTLDGVRESHAFIDSVRILNDEVSTSTDDHLCIFFHKW